MAQHFLLSSAARSISLRDVLRLSEEEAWQTFSKIRFAQNDGKPFCPHCGSTTAYDVTRKAHPRYRCKDCRKDYSPTSGTLFAYHKLPVSQYLAAIVLFVNAVKGVSALQLGRDLNISYKSAFVLAHKLREAMTREGWDNPIGGEGKIVEIDGCYVGNYTRQANLAKDRRTRKEGSGNTNKQVVVAMREREGRTLTYTFDSERSSLDFIRDYVAEGTVLHADQATSWRPLRRLFTVKTVNHRVGYSIDGIATNWAESFFSRLRRAEWGQHHRISGAYLARYAGEMAWREDPRRTPNGTLFQLAAAHTVRIGRSQTFTGYWQRHAR